MPLERLTLPIIEQTPQEVTFLRVLEAHHGEARAIAVADMAAALFHGARGKTAQRHAQKIKKHLVEEHGICIGSSCGEPSGWYLPETEAEIEATINQYRHRIISLARLIAKTKKSTPSAVLGQLRLDLFGAEMRAHS